MKYLSLLVLIIGLSNISFAQENSTYSPAVSEEVPAQKDIPARIDLRSKKMNPPKYPAAAVSAGITGTVKLLITINEEGDVVDVIVEKSSKNQDLDNAAMDAARLWEYTPAIINGVKSTSKVNAFVDFVL